MGNIILKYHKKKLPFNSYSIFFYFFFNEDFKSSFIKIIPDSFLECIYLYALDLVHKTPGPTPAY